MERKRHDFRKKILRIRIIEKWSLDRNKFYNKKIEIRTYFQRKYYW